MWSRSALPLLRDDSLRTALAQFGRDLASQGRSEQYAQDYWSTDLVSLYQDDVSIRDVLSLGDVSLSSQVTPSRFSTDIASLVQSRRFENHVVTRWTLGYDLIDSTSRVAGTVDVIVRRLDELLRE